MKKILAASALWNEGSSRINIKPILLTVATLLATGCAGLETVSDSATRLMASGSEAVSNLRGDSVGADAKQLELDVEGALANLRANGFVARDFGSASAMQSAAVMVASLGIEWHAFNDWNAQIYESLDSLRERVLDKEDQVQRNFKATGDWNGLSAEDREVARQKMSPISCFTEMGEPRVYTDFANRSVLRDLAHARTPKLAFEEWRRASTKTGKKLTWDEYQEHKLQELINDPYATRSYTGRDDYLRRSPLRDRAWRDYAERCIVLTPTVRGIYYTLNVHYGDVYGSLFSAVVDRVGAAQAHQVVEGVLRQQVGNMNGLTNALWNYSNSGKWTSPQDVRPFYLTPTPGVMPSHLGAMCSPFGSSAEDTVPRIDDIAAALGFQTNGSQRGFHCLAWGDGNWEQLASLIERESTLTRQFMASYGPIPSGYAVPSWAYPGPSQRDYQSAEHRANRHDIARGARAGSIVRTHTTCNDYAIKNSSLLNTVNLFKISYPACKALDQLNEVFKERAEFSGIHAGRNDAYMCSNQAVDYALYGNFDTSRCPRLYTFQELEQGLHKQ